MNTIKHAANVYLIIHKDCIQNDGIIPFNLNTYFNQEKHQLEM